MQNAAFRHRWTDFACCIFATRQNLSGIGDRRFITFFGKSSMTMKLFIFALSRCVSICFIHFELIHLVFALHIFLNVVFRPCRSKLAKRANLHFCFRILSNSAQTQHKCTTCVLWYYGIRLIFDRFTMTLELVLGMCERFVMAPRASPGLGAHDYISTCTGTWYSWYYSRTWLWSLREA